MELDDLELELEHADDAADLFECGSVPPINESDRSRILDAIDGKNSAGIVPFLPLHTDHWD